MTHTNDLCTPQTQSVLNQDQYGLKCLSNECPFEKYIYIHLSIYIYVQVHYICTTHFS